MRKFISLFDSSWRSKHVFTPFFDNKDKKGLIRTMKAFLSLSQVSFHNYALSTFLPFALLLFKTLRPVLESILLRKPWTRLCFLFFGWYVRFIFTPPDLVYMHLSIYYRDVHLSRFLAIFTRFFALLRIIFFYLFFVPPQAEKFFHFAACCHFFL